MHYAGTGQQARLGEHKLGVILNLRLQHSSMGFSGLLSLDTKGVTPNLHPKWDPIAYSALNGLWTK
jgi:hypothetical protein